MPDKEIEVTCPECWAENTIEADEADDEITCEECGYVFYLEENVGE